MLYSTDCVCVLVWLFIFQYCTCFCPLYWSLHLFILLPWAEAGNTVVHTGIRAAEAKPALKGQQAGKKERGGIYDWRWAWYDVIKSWILNVIALFKSGLYLLSSFYIAVFPTLALKGTDSTDGDNVGIHVKLYIYIYMYCIQNKHVYKQPL